MQDPTTKQILTEDAEIKGMWQMYNSNLLSRSEVPEPEELWSQCKASVVALPELPAAINAPISASDMFWAKKAMGSGKRAGPDIFTAV
jgi:hypothetical protein